MKNLFKKGLLYLSSFLISAGAFPGNPYNTDKGFLKAEKVDFKKFVSNKGFSDIKQASLEDGIMYFQKGKNSKADIYSYDIKNKSLVNLTADNLKGFDGDFVIFGDNVYFVRENKESFGDIYKMDLSSKELVRLTKNGFNKDLFINNGGNKILYVHKGDKSDDIFELNLSSGKSKKITDTPNLDEKNPIYSKDGTKVIYLWDDSELPVQVENLKTGKLEQILIKKGNDEEYLAVGVTNNKILYQHLTLSGRIRLESRDFNSLGDEHSKPNIYSGSFWEASKVQISKGGYFAYLGQTDESLRLIFGQEDISKTHSKMLRDFKMDKTSFVFSEDGSEVYVFSGGKMKIIENPLIKK